MNTHHGPERVLVVDDEQSILDVMAEAIRLLDLSVITAADGDEAWKVLKNSTPPQIAVLDWLMPGLDGLELCRRMRLQAAGAGAYIILLSTRAERGLAPRRERQLGTAAPTRGR